MAEAKFSHFDRCGGDASSMQRAYPRYDQANNELALQKRRSIINFFAIESLIITHTESVVVDLNRVQV